MRTTNKWAIRTAHNGYEVVPPMGIHGTICEVADRKTAILIKNAPETLAALIEASKLLNEVRHYLPKSIKSSDKFHFENMLNNVINKAILKATAP